MIAISTDPPRLYATDVATPPEHRDAFPRFAGAGEGESVLRAIAADLIALQHRAERAADALAAPTAGPRVASGAVLSFEYQPATGATGWSGDVEAVLGYAPSERLARLDGWISIVHPDDRPRLETALREGGARTRLLTLRIADARREVRTFELAVGDAIGRAGLLAVLKERAESPAPEASVATVLAAVRRAIEAPLAEISDQAARLRGEWIIQAEPALEARADAIHRAALRLAAVVGRLAELERDPAALHRCGDLLADADTQA